MRTREVERDYARYGAARRSPARLPRSAAEALDFALRALRESLGHVVSASLVPATLVVLALSYTFTFAIPKIGETNDPSSITRQVSEFAVAILVALGVALPLFVLALAGLSVVALETAREWTKLPRRALATGIAPYSLAARILGRSVLLSLRLFFIGFALLLAAGFSLALLGRDSPIPGLIGIIGILLALFGALLGVFLFSRSVLAVPAGLYEGLTPKAALARAKALSTGRQSLAIGGTATESALIMGSLLSGLLILGVNGVMGTFNISDTVQELFSTPLVRATAQEILRILPAFLVALVVLPYIALVNAMSYFERRVAVEGFDIELMTERLETRRR